ncbi:hypothetical protein EYF80_014906 [Liparis tanakae]|uniref:Uncharacterized protein n=1 Tax=Liparis tanakae TaxID=230148 RepID=A0A4Z2I9V5_9TELE|nr:hypothetical protein EYF80_014906 [Liparis tanakae]
MNAANTSVSLELIGAAVRSLDRFDPQPSPFGLIRPRSRRESVQSQSSFCGTVTATTRCTEDPCWPVVEEALTSFMRDSSICTLSGFANPNLSYRDTVAGI